jgi:hypothetical protein
VIARRPDGAYNLRLSAGERELLAELADQLEELVDAGPDDPLARRLFPVAYPDDEKREAEYRLLAGEELRSSRRAALETMRSTATANVLTEEEVGAWLQSVNALRLVLGTRLDVKEDDTGEVDPADPDADARVLYHYLSALADQIVTSLSTGL